MRESLEYQLKKIASISSIDLDYNCRDSLIPLLKSFQYVYKNDELYKTVYELIENDIEVHSRSENFDHKGRHGLNAWQIFIFGMLRQTTNFTYDKLMDMSNNHKTLREFLGCSDFLKERFSRSCINDNVRIVSVSTWEKINNLILEKTHNFSKKAITHLRVDTFVIDTLTHYPSDSRQLFDAMNFLLKKAGFLYYRYREVKGVSIWRQHKKLQSNLPKLLKSVRTAMKSRGNRREKNIEKANTPLFEMAESIYSRMKNTIKILKEKESNEPEKYKEYMSIAEEIAQKNGFLETLIRQAKGSAEGKRIPHKERIYSIHEDHAELIHRGKTPNPYQMGRKIFIIADLMGNIVYHKKLEKGTTDDEPLIDAIKILQKKYNNQIKIVSADRGFHTPHNQQELQKIVSTPTIAIKGKSKKYKLNTEEYKNAMQTHSLVESTINELQHTGLKLCLEKTELGFDKNLIKGILARNLILFGKRIIQKENPNTQAAITLRSVA